jgi:hypothetical protein
MFGSLGSRFTQPTNTICMYVKSFRISYLAVKVIVYLFIKYKSLYVFSCLSKIFISGSRIVKSVQNTATEFGVTSHDP